MTPTFSLGCGTWGGSNTTDNINYRNLLNVKTVSRRQTPPQWFRVPSDTYFNPGCARQPAPAGRRPSDDRHRQLDRGPRRGRGGPPATSPPAPCTSTRASSPNRPRRRSAPESSCSSRRAPTRSSRRRRLGDGRRQGHATVPREPRAEHSGALAAVPRRAQANRRVPPDRPQGAAGRHSDHVRHGL